MKRLMILCSACVLCFPLIAHAGAEAKTIKKSTVTYKTGPMVDVFNDSAMCQENLEACYASLEDCENYCPVDPDTGSHKPKPKPKKVYEPLPTTPKKPSAKAKCIGKYNNGKWSVHGWDLEFCDMEASMDGHCLTLKEMYKVAHCLNKKIADLDEKLEGFEQTEKPIMMDGNYVTPEQLQAVVNQLMAHINDLRAIVETLAVDVQQLKDDLDALTKRVDKLEKKVAELEKRLRRIEACVDQDPEYEGFETDYDGNILPESYIEVCGILAHIPAIEERLEELEKKVDPMFEKFKSCLDPMDWEPEEYAKACPYEAQALCKEYKDDPEEALKKVDGDEQVLKKICDQSNGKPSVSHAPALKLHTLGTFVEDGFNTFFVGGILEWKGLILKKDDKDLIGFSLFAGALGGVMNGSDAGIAYGARMYIWPGPQDVVGLFLGYEGMSSGIFEAERPMVVPDPDNPGHVINTGEMDPDRQQHAGMLGISLGHLWPIKQKNGKLHSFGIEGTLGVGLGWQDDALNSGLVGVFSADFGVVYSITW